LQLFVLHWRSLELRHNGEAVPFERAGDVRAAAPVGGRRIRGRPAASPVYDDFEFFACAQRRGERRDELARQVPITADNTQTSRRRFRFVRPQTFGHRYLHSPAARDLTKFFSVSAWRWGEIPGFLVSAVHRGRPENRQISLGQGHGMECV